MENRTERSPIFKNAPRSSYAPWASVPSWAVLCKHNQPQNVMKNMTERSPIFKNAPSYPHEFPFPRGRTLQTKSTTKCNEKQDGALANFQKRSKVFLLMFSVVSQRRSPFLGICVSNGAQNGSKITKMGAKWCHNEALGTISTSAVPNTAPKLQKHQKWAPVDPPPSAHVGVKIGLKSDRG